MAKKDKRKLKSYLKSNKASFFDFDFDQLYIYSNTVLKNRIIKESLKPGVNPSEVKFPINTIKNHLWYELSVYGVDKENKEVLMGEIKEYSKLTPKELFAKYMTTFYEWKNSDEYVDKSGNNRMWNERISPLSTVNRFNKRGMPTKFKVRVHMVS